MTMKSNTKDVKTLTLHLQICEMAYRAKSEAIKQEIFRSEAIDTCKTDEEKMAIEKIGPKFIAQHFHQLEKFLYCSCTSSEHEYGYPFDALKLCEEIFESINVLFINDDYNDLYAGFWYILTDGRKVYRSCFYRHDLIRAYCVIKNDPSILTRVAEQLKAKEVAK